MLKASRYVGEAVVERVPRRVGEAMAVWSHRHMGDAVAARVPRCVGETVIVTNQRT